MIFNPLLKLLSNTTAGNHLERVKDDDADPGMGSWYVGHQPGQPHTGYPIISAAGNHIAVVVDGKDPKTPAQAVARALEIMRPCYLGLETPSQGIQAIIDRGWAELSGEQPCTDRK